MAQSSRSKTVSPILKERDLRSKIARLEQRVAALQALQKAATSLASELNLEQLLARILQSAVDVMHASAGSLLLHDPVTDELVFEVVQGGGGEALRRERIRADQGIAGAVFSTRQPTIVDNVERDERFLSGFDANFGFHTRSLIAVPLISQGRPIGVIEVLNKADDRPFTPEDQELLLAFGAQSAVAIENARLYQQVVGERDRILAVEEQVRRELARDLHDGPSQLLSAITMGLRFVRDLVDRHPESAQEEIANLERLTKQSLRQIRNMLFDLRPLVLETQGLRAALEVYTQHFDEQEIEVHLDAGDFAARFPAKTEAAIFSIIQEAVGNARKHATPKNIWITFRQEDATLTITVRDDGCGFDLEGVEAAYGQRGSLGLLNMKERAEMASAQLTIESKCGQGTSVILVMPLAAAPRR
jgi:signal transduction histidine kinase